MSLSATDNANNRQSIFIDIVVADQTPPVIRLLENPLVVEAAVPFDLTFPTVEVVDAVDDLQAFLTSNATTDLTDMLGTFTVKLELSRADSAGNEAEPAYLMVVVQDTRGPVGRLG